MWIQCPECLGEGGWLGVDDIDVTCPDCGGSGGFREDDIDDDRDEDSDYAWHYGAAPWA